MKITRVIEGTEAEIREGNLEKRKFGARGSSFQWNQNFKKTNTAKSQNKGNNWHNGRKSNLVTTAADAT